jgi:homoserine O-succinyltransferase
MPINIPNDLPAKHILEEENIYLITQERAEHQDIRPLKIILLNLMPKKIETENQLLRLLGNTPLQIDIELLQTATHTAKNTSAEHMFKFYKTFDEIKEERFDGLIVTGAPVEQIPFEEVDYWEELTRIFDWAKGSVYSTFHICWGAQAGLYHYYGIPKLPLREKMFGIFPHRLNNPNHLLVRGFDELFYVPHSRHTTVDEDAIKHHPELEILSYSELSGVNIVASKNNRHFFVCGHAEYDRRTLAEEYFRDLKKGLPISVPYHYFPDDDPQKRPPFIWRGHANLLFKNWLNLVYQHTPYDLADLTEG